MKAKITKTDLKKALADTEAMGWSGNHCLIAQTGKRIGKSWPVITRSNEADDLMDLFDRIHRTGFYGWSLDEGEREIALTLLELVLPMEIEF